MVSQTDTEDDTDFATIPFGFVLEWTFAFLDLHLCATKNLYSSSSFSCALSLLQFFFLFPYKCIYLSCTHISRSLSTLIYLCVFIIELSTLVCVCSNCVIFYCVLLYEKRDECDCRLQYTDVYLASSSKLTSDNLSLHFLAVYRSVFCHFYLLHWLFAFELLTYLVLLTTSHLTLPLPLLLDLQQNFTHTHTQIQLQTHTISLAIYSLQQQ